MRFPARVGRSIRLPQRNDSSPAQVSRHGSSDAAYAANAIKSSKLIFATTTPVPEGCEGRVAKDEIGYNEAATRVMKDEGLTIDDLHALVEPKLADIQLPHNVHFSNPGYNVLAEQVAASIKTALGK